MGGHPQRPQRQNIHTIRTRVQILCGLRMHLHGRQTRRIPCPQEPLHPCVPSPGHRAGSSPKDIQDRPRHRISEQGDDSTSRDQLRTSRSSCCQRTLQQRRSRACGTHDPNYRKGHAPTRQYSKEILVLRNLPRHLSQQHDHAIARRPYQDHIRNTLQAEARHHKNSALRCIHMHIQRATRPEGPELRAHKHSRSLHRHSLPQENPRLLHHRRHESIVYKAPHCLRPIPLSFQAERHHASSVANIPQPHHGKGTSSYPRLPHSTDANGPTTHGGTTGQLRRI